MKSFKKITSAVMAIFMLLNCFGCSDFSENDTKQSNEDTTTTTAIYEAISACLHSNGGDYTSLIINERYHKNGLICFDCSETVWDENQEEHGFSNLDGTCPCGYRCEHGYGDDFYYEMTDEIHTVVFVCNTCHSIIYEESNKHSIEDGRCIFCEYKPIVFDDVINSYRNNNFTEQDAIVYSSDSAEVYTITLVVTKDQISWNDSYANDNNDLPNELTAWIVYRNGKELFRKWSNEGCAMSASSISDGIQDGAYVIKAYSMDDAGNPIELVGQGGTSYYDPFK